MDIIKHRILLVLLGKILTLFYKIVGGKIKKLLIFSIWSVLKKRIIFISSPPEIAKMDTEKGVAVRSEIGVYFFLASYELFRFLLSLCSFSRCFKLTQKNDKI